MPACGSVNWAVADHPAVLTLSSVCLDGLGAAKELAFIDANGHRTAKRLHDLHALPLLSLPELKISEDDLARP